MFSASGLDFLGSMQKLGPARFRLARRASRTCAEPKNLPEIERAQSGERPATADASRPGAG